jgi:hypothetical protein
MTTISAQPAAGKRSRTRRKKKNKNKIKVVISVPRRLNLYIITTPGGIKKNEDEQRVENVGWKKKELAAKRMRQRCIPQAPERRKQEKEEEKSPSSLRRYKSCLGF